MEHARRFEDVIAWRGDELAHVIYGLRAVIGQRKARRWSSLLIPRGPSPLDRKEFRRRIAARANSVRFEELDRLLRLYGWELDTIRGSHHVFKREGTSLIVVPHRRPHVLAVYVRRVLEATMEDDE